MVRRYGPEALTAGYKVTTTIDSRLQAAADRAIREALVAYDERHGYRGPLARVELPAVELSSSGDERLLPMLADYPDRAGTEIALVLEADDAEAELYLRRRGRRTLGLDAVAWAAPYVDDRRVGPRPRAVTDVLRPGDIVRIRISENGELRLAQLPDVQGALVALDPLDGAVAALTGGFDFYLSNFNRAVQSRRQPGSVFKPFVYSAALEHGFTPASIVNDAPLSLGSAELGSVWKPTNDSGRFYGDTRLREALVRSLNLASVRVVRDTGLDNALTHLRAFGFDELALPRNLTVSLGAGGASPLDLASAYAVFANGGLRVEPYFIERIEDARGNVLYEANATFACPECRRACPECEGPGAVRAISEQNAYLITDMLRDAIRRGTGRRAAELGRDDLAGKTGTSNDYVDAWFAGYNADLVATAWVGFDSQSRSLGRAAGGQESGSRTALPMWNLFMAEALAGRPERTLERPPGIVELRIDPVSGRVADGRIAETMFEKFFIDRIPQRETRPLHPNRDATPWLGAETQPPSLSLF
jgi:penicillin-binding protein 1A